MRRRKREPGPGTAVAAFWWALAAVHVVPVVRVALSLAADPVAHATTIVILLGVIAFCLVAAGSLRHPSLRARPRGATIAFLLAAILAHHDAVGSLPVAEVPAPVIPVVLAAAAVAGRGVLREGRRRWRTAGGAIGAAFARIVDRHFARGIMAMATVTAPPSPWVRPSTARGPPA